MNVNLNELEICLLILIKDPVGLSFFLILTLNRYYCVLGFGKMVNVIGEFYSEEHNSVSSSRVRVEFLQF